MDAPVWHGTRQMVACFLLMNCHGVFTGCLCPWPWILHALWIEIAYSRLWLPSWLTELLCVSFLVFPELALYPWDPMIAVRRPVGDGLGSSLRRYVKGHA